MTNQPIMIHSWPRAILHIDADAFFASCEQAVNPELKGKPVITGKERGIVAAASYEAKRRGVERGMTLFQVKKVCPDAVMLPSDYETYSLFSLRMFEILRRFSPDVEEYSIDEAFVDLTGLRRLYHGSYGEIAKKIQEAIEKELGLSVSIGVSLTKVLAKAASKYKKPHGLVMIPGHDIHTYLAKLPIEKIWGIGPNTAELLKKFSIRTALDFARKEKSFINKYLSKPYREVWEELNGRSVYPVTIVKKEEYKSISKTKTFTPPSNDEAFVLGQLSRNLENACIKARRHNLSAKVLILYLKTHDFRHNGVELNLTRPTAYPLELFTILREGFKEIFRPKTLYRATGVVLGGLITEESVQYTLFDNVPKIEKLSRIYEAIDNLSERYGKHTVVLASTLPLKLQQQHEGERGDVPKRKTELFKGENKRQRLGVPMLDIKI